MSVSEKNLSRMTTVVDSKFYCNIWYYDNNHRSIKNY
jgi:hypothetical protein